MILAAPAIAHEGGHPQPQSSTECAYPAVPFFDELFARNPGAAVVESMHGSEGRAFVERWNAMPPPTSYRADAVMVFETPLHPGLYFVFLLDQGCVVAQGGVRIDVYESMKKLFNPAGFEI